ncbi:MAG: hypothetical protein ABJA78_17000 [Ferruginibacter sp.]
MKKISESSFGTHLANAQNLATVLAGFNNYQASMPTASLDYFNQLIASIRAANNASAIGRHELSLATEKRQQLFSRHQQSIKKLLSPIGAAIRSQYGLRSKEAADFSAKLKNMRGKRVGKKTAVMVDGKEQETKSISVSHAGVGTITQHFADMISVIGQLQPAFNPVNKDISMEKLQDTHNNLLTVNNSLASSHAEWIRARLVRDEQYLQLKESVKLIKESVKAQYGLHSTEYTIIKILVI